MTIEKVTDQKQQVTDAQVIKLLSDIGVDTDYVEFHDYDRTRPYAKKYIDRKSNLRLQVISNLPMCRKDDGSKTLAGWESSGSTLYNKNNLFEAEIIGARLSMSCVNDQPSGIMKSDELVWNPQLFIGGEEIALISSSILETDPTNANYHDNVIAFDYGVCKRYLRIIEGRMREWWEFTERPPGEIRVKHNQSGSAFLKLGFGMSGIEPLDIAIENGDEEVLRNLDYALPFTIGASSTFYPDANPETATVDGYVERYTSGNWSTIRTGAGTGASDTASAAASGYQLNYSDFTYSYLKRIITLFDTSSLSDTDTIIGAVISFYVMSSYGVSGWGISTCNPASNTALTAADYAVSNFGSAVLAANSAKNATAYNGFEFTPTGIATINTTGVSKYSLRLLHDIQNFTPNYAASSVTIADQSAIWCHLNVYLTEGGANYKPKLVVTTETPSGGGREPRGRYHGV